MKHIIVEYNSFLSCHCREEMNFIWLARKWSALLTEMYTFNSRLITALIVVVYVLTQHQLSAAKVFPMLSFFNILSESLLNQVPWGIKTWLEIKVSTDRIQVKPSKLVIMG